MAGWRTGFRHLRVRETLPPVAYSIAWCCTIKRFQLSCYSTYETIVHVDKKIRLFYATFKRLYKLRDGNGLVEDLVLNSERTETCTSMGGHNDSMAPERLN